MMSVHLGCYSKIALVAWLMKQLELFVSCGGWKPRSRWPSGESPHPGSELPSSHCVLIGGRGPECPGDCYEALIPFTRAPLL